jgi:hypothetical protein
MEYNERIEIHLLLTLSGFFYLVVNLINNSFDNILFLNLLCPGHICDCCVQPPYYNGEIPSASLILTVHNVIWGVCV